ncbi:polysaccharide deacetylase family protein [Caproiciproducens sp. R1]|uniref:polysaccharide deacetylase family protein n=1 Tax=Caproiciproducens sp. R1 TaxID=3435000 RepID=UPI004033C453
MFVTVRMNRKLSLMLFTTAAIVLIIAFGAVNPAKATDNGKGIKLPVLMYHSMLKDKSYQGVYVISPDIFEKDLQYLQKKGYTAVDVQDLLDYVNQKKPLPSKPVMITFDDGYYNNYLYAYPLVKKYNMKMVLSPIGYYTDLFSDSVSPEHANYSHCTWDELNEMIASGRVEIQNHTYNLHENKNGRLGAGMKRGESVSSYTSLLTEDLSKMQEKVKEHTGDTPTAFVYPFGAISGASVPIIRKLGFQASLTCESRMNYITEDPECLYGLGRYLRLGKVTTEAYFRKIKLD